MLIPLKFKEQLPLNLAAKWSLAGIILATALVVIGVVVWRTDSPAEEQFPPHLVSEAVKAFHFFVNESYWDQDDNEILSSSYRGAADRVGDAPSECRQTQVVLRPESKALLLRSYRYQVLSLVHRKFSPTTSAQWLTPYHSRMLHSYHKALHR